MPKPVKKPVVTAPVPAEVAAPAVPVCCRCKKPLGPLPDAEWTACRECGEPNRVSLKPAGGQHGPSPVDGDGRNMTAEQINPPPVKAVLDAQMLVGKSTTVVAATEAIDAASAKLAANLGLAPQPAAEKPAPQPQRGYREPPHVVVLARAGTGKTTTLVGGIEVMLGLTPRDARGNPMTPSPQQAAVWDALKASAPRPNEKWYSVCFVAFNRSIRDELKRRLPTDRRVEAKTMHQLGMGAVLRAFKGQLRDEPTNADRANDLIAELLSEDLRTLRKTRPLVLRAARELSSLCKMNLVGLSWGADDARWEEALDELADRHDVEVDGPSEKSDPDPTKPAPPSVKDIVYPLIPRLLDRAKDVAKDGVMDFDDMVWLPVALDLPVWQNTVLLVDEAQDLSRCQQALARKAGRRLVLCGDDRQAIYGFASADSDSLPRMTRELGATPRGCVVMPLNVTRRCGKKIVEEARAYVQDFHAHESNPEGEVKTAQYPVRKVRKSDGSYEWQTLPLEQTYVPLVKDGDMVLCRANAPLVRECLRFLKLGRRAKIQGRKIGDQLISLVEKLGAESIPDLVAKLSDWLVTEVNKELAERNPSENKLRALQDRHDCIRCFVDVAHSVDDVKVRIAALFSDDAAAGNPVVFSSIHRAKGLESSNVFYILGFGPPLDKLQPWERQQEANMQYVAVTRAIDCLTFVS